MPDGSNFGGLASQSALTSARTKAPGRSGRRYALADVAFAVRSYLPDGERLTYVRRGDPQLYVYTGAQAGLSLAVLQRMADDLNAACGVSREAAKALGLDWSAGFKNEPTDPRQVKEWLRDGKLLKLANGGTRQDRAVSTGWLQIEADLHGLPVNPRIHRGSKRHGWLLAHNELMWAETNGRKTERQMLPTERAALAVYKAAQRNAAVERLYKEKYSRFMAVFLAGIGCHEAAAQITARDREERRDLLISLRRKHRRSLRQFFAAIAAYKQLRQLQ